MTTLFISDLHLSDTNQQTLTQFEHFIASQGSQAQALYILGDLFEAWVGDDDHSDCARRVAHALNSLSTLGINIYFVHGNRDFLLGEQYAKQCGMTMLSDPTVIDCEGKNILITHGDLLCTGDKAYQKMRIVFRKPWVQRLFLMLPRKIREWIGKQMRSNSSQSKMADYMDANLDTVSLWFEKNHCDIMVHGHTHKPYHHQVEKTHRYVLGAWDIRPVILVIAGGQVMLRELLEFPR